MDNHLTIITGHFGSGKTEFAVNFALNLAAIGKPVTLADLDIVNPYFCSRERKAELEAAGVHLILPSKGNGDLPALNPALLSMFENNNAGVMDVGGDAAGARVLGRFATRILEIPHDLYVICNFNRPETATPQQALRYIDDITASAKIPITGLINNTHLCSETTKADILRGAELSYETAMRCGVPVVYHAVERKYKANLDATLLGEGELFVMEIYMKKPWEE
jgi:Mrp family chromosome partitioning ATPase